MKIVPMNGMVLVKENKDDVKTPSGIVLAPAYRKYTEFHVIATDGNTDILNKNVILSQHASPEKVDEFYLIREDDIIAVIEPIEPIDDIPLDEGFEE